MLHGWYNKGIKCRSDRSQCSVLLTKQEARDNTNSIEKRKRNKITLHLIINFEKR